MVKNARKFLRKLEILSHEPGPIYWGQNCEKKDWKREEECGIGRKITDEDDRGRKKEMTEDDKEQTKGENKVCNIYSRLLACGQYSGNQGCACKPLTRKTDYD